MLHETVYRTQSIMRFHHIKIHFNNILLSMPMSPANEVYNKTGAEQVLYCTDKIIPTLFGAL
jgi:hypothetical protein